MGFGHVKHLLHVKISPCKSPLIEKIPLLVYGGIDKQEFLEMQKDALIAFGFLIFMLIAPIPLIHFFHWWGLLAYVLISGVGLYYSFRVEKFKKKYDIQTFKEIDAFFEGKSLSEIEKARESGKRPYQKMLGMVAAAALTLIIAVLIALLFRGL